MKLKVVMRIMLTLLLVSAFCVTLDITPVAAHPAVLKVPDDFPTIQDAINNALPGYIIHVRAGTYVQTADLIVDKQVTLIGEDGSTTIIDLAGSYYIDLTADGVVFMEFTIRNGYHGIASWYGVGGHTIKDNYFYGITAGGLGHAICLSGSYSQIIGNTIMACDVGIDLYTGSTFNIIRANTMTINNYGIVTDMGAHDNEIYYNNFFGSLISHVWTPNDPSVVQTWDDAGQLNKGNYWDGHVAGPYPIDNYNVDNFPLFGVAWAPNPGDINYDGRVNLFDVVITATSFGSRWCTKDPDWNPQADINNDLLVDIYDLVIIGINYGYVDP